MPAHSRINRLGIAVVLTVTLGSLSSPCCAGVCPYGTTLPGIDVSQFQGTINWSNVKAAGIVFAYAKATEGTSFTDPEFSANWAGMKAAGVFRGAYLFFHSNVDPTTEANHFLNVMGTIQPGDFPPMLDVEVTDGQAAGVIAANLMTCANRIQAATGRAPVIYASPAFWTGSVGSTGFSGLPLWVANWGVTCPGMPVGWTNWAIWQYSDTGTVAGISAAVDLDELNGSIGELLAFVEEPNLDITWKTASQISLTWPTLAIGFRLQQSSDLGATNWANVTNTPAVVNNQEQVVLGTSTNHAFFRLVHP
ncbi:MAG TPA: GH25 family lysozyme [Candidatus Acidoferrum sp.]|jgi:lysozyme|nr:GH25 family lysozyme [Candidatus Acidoferrum sp.]